MNTKSLFFILLIILINTEIFSLNDQVINFNDYNKSLFPDKKGALAADNLVWRDYRLGKHGMHYSEVCAAYGAFVFAGLTGNKTLMKNLVRKYSNIPLEFERRSENQSKPFIPVRDHVDDFVFGALPLEIYMQTKDQRYLKIGLDFADRQWLNPEPDGLTSQKRWWIDDMYMVSMLQVQAYRATKNPVYIERAAKFLAAYLDRLQQSNGLFRHGDISPFYWGRGNGWVASALAETLKSIPEDNPERKKLMEGYLKMMDALVKYQAESGMWLQVIDKPDFWPETSCTAMFLFAINTGINKGWLKDEKYKQSVKKGYFTLLKYLNGSGELSDVCEGTGQIDDVKYYYDRKRITADFHGQAPFIWLMNSFLE